MFMYNYIIMYSNTTIGKKHQSYDDFNTISMRVAETNHDFLPSARAL